MSYLDRLLEKLEDAEARTQLSGLAQKHPEIQNWVVDPTEVERANKFAKWADEEWDSEHDMTHAEYRMSQQIQQLEAQGAGMELDELNQHLGRFMSEKGLVDKGTFDKEIKAREDMFNSQLNTMARIATRVPYLNGKHVREFGEDFDPDQFLREATEKGFTDLDRFYDEFTAEKRKAKNDAEIERRIQDARKEERMKVLEESSTGHMPTLDSGAPEIGHFEARLKGIGRSDKQVSAVPADAELGRLQIARAAAAAGDRADLAGRVN